MLSWGESRGVRVSEVQVRFKICRSRKAGKRGSWRMTQHVISQQSIVAGLSEDWEFIIV